VRTMHGHRVLGNYELLAIIGRGGMSTVHLAIRTTAAENEPRRYVAVKELTVEPSQIETARAALADEARAVSLIRHPNVIALLEVIDDGETLALVTPYLHGLSLSEVFSSVAPSPMPTAIASRIVGDTLLGVHAAHEAIDKDGKPIIIVHRDISPQNILIHVDGATSILDFGIAKAVGRQQQTTIDGSLKGKLAYMAPEQLHGRQISRQTDLFSCAVVLWEMLAGKRLFGGENEADTIRKALAAEVPRLAEARNDLPAGMDIFFRSALARAETDRFLDALSMRTALHALLPQAETAEVAQWLADRCGSALNKRREITARADAPTATAAPEVARAKIAPYGQHKPKSAARNVPQLSASPVPIRDRTRQPRAAPRVRQAAYGVLVATCAAILLLAPKWATSIFEAAPRAADPTVRLGNLEPLRPLRPTARGSRRP
jgi:eukaryotic-like serine/threonine-protein kinase